MKPYFRSLASLPNVDESPHRIYVGAWVKTLSAGLSARFCYARILQDDEWNQIHNRWPGMCNGRSVMPSGKGKQASGSESDGLCATLKVFLREYDSALRDHSRAVAELTRRMGIVTKDEYERLSRFSEEKRLQVEQARLATEEHRAKHGC